MSTSSLYPATRPSLVLDFANTKQLDPRITYSRASTGTYYDGTTSVVAEQNLLLHPQTFDNASWSTKSGVTVTADATIAPDGTSTADAMFETATTAIHYIRQPVTTTSKQTFAFSVFAKPNGRDFCILQLISGSDYYTAWFNVTTGTTGSTASNGASAVVNTPTLSANGFYRLSVVVTFTTAKTAINADVYAASTDGVSIYAGDITKGLYIWGAKLEQRSTVTAYTPTTNAPITNYIPVLQTAAAGVPRFDHDPVTGESKGFLIEEQRTNLLNYSEDFANAGWTKGSSTIVSNTGIAPDGTQTADTIIPNTILTAQHQTEQSYSVSAATYTASIYVKPNGYSYCMFGLGGTTSKGKYFNIANGTVLGDWGTAGATGTITSVGNGWFRISITLTATAGNSPALFRVGSDGVGNSFSGDGYSGIYIWGAQLEAGSFATSYIPTVASQVTRSADNASMTGVNFSSWYRADEGTFFAEVKTFGLGAPNGDSMIVGGDTVTPDNRVNFHFRSSTINSQFGAAGFGYSGAIINGSFVGTQTKAASAYKTKDSAGAANGGTVATNSSTLVPWAINGIGIGYQLNMNNSYLNGTIKRIAYWPKRLTNTELQSLTS